MHDKRVTGAFRAGRPLGVAELSCENGNRSGEEREGLAMKRAKSNYTVRSVSHALDILESFTRAESDLGVTELSRRLDLHKNNVFRLLATLEHRGYVEQNKETGSYRLGPKTLQIGCTFIAQRECRRQARPFLEQLAERTRETAVIAVLRGDKVVFMDSVEPERTVRVVSRVGAMLPAHCTATGKAQLAFLPHEEIERLYANGDLGGPTGRCVRSRKELTEELTTVAERGWAQENEESDHDVRGFAVPVRDFSRTVIAAIGVIAPATRLDLEQARTNGMIGLLREIGMALSHTLGYNDGNDKP